MEITGEDFLKIKEEVGKKIKRNQPRSSYENNIKRKESIFAFLKEVGLNTEDLNLRQKR